MNKPYLVMVRNLLWARALTKHGAERIIEKLQTEKGIKAVLAYDIGNGGN